MRLLVFALQICGIAAVVVPCLAFDVPASIPDAKARGKMTKERPLTKEEFLVEKLLKPSVSLDKMAVPALRAVQERIEVKQKEAKARLKQIRESYQYQLDSVQQFQSIYDTMKESKHYHPHNARLYEELKVRLPQMEKCFVEILQREERALQAITEWRKLSEIVETKVSEREHAGGAARPKKK